VRVPTTGNDRGERSVYGEEGERERERGSKRVETKTTKPPIVLALGQTKTAEEAARRVRAVCVCERVRVTGA
jgi:hypothetical protein